jgi:hypothetical protein
MRERGGRKSVRTQIWERVYREPAVTDDPVDGAQSTVIRDPLIELMPAATIKDFLLDVFH